MRKIRISYDVVTPESAAEGDFAETGWIDEDGVAPENLVAGASATYKHIDELADIIAAAR